MIIFVIAKSFFGVKFECDKKNEKSCGYKSFFLHFLNPFVKKKPMENHWLYYNLTKNN